MCIYIFFFLLFFLLNDHQTDWINWEGAQKIKGEGPGNTKSVRIKCECTFMEVLPGRIQELCLLYLAAALELGASPSHFVPLETRQLLFLKITW